jgi:WD40 repeat protein
MSQIAILRSSLRHRDFVFSVAFHPTEPLLATGSLDNIAKLWRFSPDGTAENNMQATCVATLEGHVEGVKYVAFHSTFPLLATGSYDNTAKLWRFSPDGSTVTCVATLAGHSNWVESVAFHPTLPLLATVKSDFTTKLWRFSPNGSAENNMRLICVAILQGHHWWVYSVAFHPTEPLLATGSGDNTVKLWRFEPDGSAATCVATLEGHSKSVMSVAFHPTLPFLATGSDTETHRETYRETDSRHDTAKAKLWRFLPDGTAENNMQAICVATLEGHRKRVNSVAFHPTLPLLATGSYDRTVKLWLFSPDGSAENNMQATCVETLEGHRRWVYSVAFHPTAPLLATGSEDKFAKIWYISTSALFQNRLSVSASASGQNRPSVSASASGQIRPSVSASANNSSLTIYMIDGTKVIRIGKNLLKPIKNSTKNSANKSCPSFRPVYDELMIEDLNGQFRFEFQGQNAIDVTGLTRIVFDKLLPIYTNLFFEKSKTSTFIILKEKVDIELLVQHTNQIIKLAKAAKSQILLGINPELIDLLLSEDLKNYFSNNKINKTKNNKNKTEKEKQLEKFYDFVNQAIQNSSFDELNNQSNSTFLRINKNKNGKNTVIQKYKTKKEGEIKNALLREIRLRRFLVECGFSSWEEVHQMYSFIQTYWNTSNKITFYKNGREVSLDLFVPILKLDVESFKKRIKIIREDTREIIDLSSIPEDEKYKLYATYPAFKPLLDYILNPHEEANENRKTFVNYVTGTAYSPAEILIILTNNIMNPRLHDGQPFYGHSCSSIIDLYKAHEKFNGKITTNIINAQLKATISQNSNIILAER